MHIVGCFVVNCLDLLGKANIILLHKIALIAPADFPSQYTWPEEEKSVSVGLANNLSPDSNSA